MSEFKGKIPLTPNSASVIYAHPYQKPSYQLNEFKIDYNDFPLKDSTEKILLEKKELEEKISKIYELIRLKKLEKSIQSQNEMTEERKKIKNDLETLQKSIIDLSNYAADLSALLFNYRDTKTEVLFNELNNIVFQEKLNIIGDDENARCEEIKAKFESLIADPPRKKRKH